MMADQISLVEADRLLARGDLEEVISTIDLMLTQAGHEIDQDGQALVHTISELTEALRWERKFDQAIDFQKRLAKRLPTHASSSAVLIARLQIESGSVTEGLESLSREAARMGPFEGPMLLAQANAWLGDYPGAEMNLKMACEAKAATAGDRASAWYLLFRILGTQRRVAEAVEVWETACALNPELSQTTPELLRMLIYWYHYKEARAYLAREPLGLTRDYYSTLVKTREAPGHGPADWAWIMEVAQDGLTDDIREYVEAALRCGRPDLVLNVLMPVIERKELSRWSLQLAGLAWAQQRDVGRAHWALGAAMRLADQEIPRPTRPGYGDARIFDADSRMTYGEIPIDNDIREVVDPYFMPRPKRD
jgi:tetratricopeptide (TPR) repeat protein